MNHESWDAMIAAAPEVSRALAALDLHVLMRRGFPVSDRGLQDRWRVSRRRVREVRAAASSEAAALGHLFGSFDNIVGSARRDAPPTGAGPAADVPGRGRRLQYDEALVGAIVQQLSTRGPTRMLIHGRPSLHAIAAEVDRAWLAGQIVGCTRAVARASAEEAHRRLDEGVVAT